MKTKEISKNQFLDFMENYAPKELAESFDNVGLLVDNSKKSFSKVLFALDVTSKVIEEAISINANLICTHHPIMFDALKKIDGNTKDGKLVMSLIKNNIALFSAHTNLDSCEHGINTLLCKKFDLQKHRALTPKILKNKLQDLGLARKGFLKKQCTLEQLINKTKAVLNIQNVRFYGDLQQKINFVALSSGSGGDNLKDAINSGADVFISGDIRHNVALTAKEFNIAIIDAGHYETEVIIFESLINSLQLHFNKLEYSTEFVLSQKQQPVMKFF